MTPPPSKIPESLWKRRVRRYLDLLYPSYCALCKTTLEEGASLCRSCRDDLPRIAAPFCESCGEAFHGKIEGTFECPNCSGLSFAFDFARPAMLRDDRTLDLVHRLKYGREIHLARELGGLAWHAFDDPRLSAALEGKWPVIPVPLHRSRLRERHFNQAEEIARSLSALSGCPVVAALQRVRCTETQTLLSRRQRMDNLKGAFAITPQGRKLVSGRSPGVVLVDDVLTTGSTVNECARVLRKAGIKRILVVTVMRG